MSKKNARILLVISNRLETDEEIYETVSEFRKSMGRFQALNSAKPECFLLYVGPQVPSYALQTPEMIQYAMNESKRGLQILQNVGRILDIPKSRQIAVAGSVNLQAWQISKLLKVDKVLGYSKTFVKFYSCLKIVSHLLESIFKTPFTPKLQKQHY